MREQVVGALVNKAKALGQLGRSEDAMRVYDDVIARSGDATNQLVRQQVARALFYKDRREPDAST